MSEFIQESENGEKSAMVVEGSASSGCMAERQRGAGQPLKAPKAVSSHGEEAAADSPQMPFWQADVSIACLAATERPGFGRG